MNAHQRRVVLRKAWRSVCAPELTLSELIEAYDYPDDGVDPEVCPACDGDGGDPMNDYILSCDHCMGEGRVY